MMLLRRSKLHVIGAVSVCSVALVFFLYQILTYCLLNRQEEPKMVYRGNDLTRSIFETVLSQPKSKAFIGEKLVHLDLKGAPPLISYFREFFPYIRKLGATGVLIEYEDMFPYKDELEDIRALNAYEPSTIQTILKLADINDLKVIPLVQTFGHLEFLLKLEKYKDLREVSDVPQMICPSNDKALLILKKMIDQIIEAHPKSRYIHIGCDEVRYLGKCRKCRSAMFDNKWDTTELYLSHVKYLSLYINKTYPGVRPIIWGDLINTCSGTILRKSEIPSLVDVMVWKYVPNVSSYITNEILTMYANVFKSIWIASAFKGASGNHQKLTDVKLHVENHRSWMTIVSKWKSHIHFKGIALTGWQRYDHFAGLCELLPVSIPALAMSLMYLRGCREGSSSKDILKHLQCKPPFSLSPSSFEIPGFTGECNFPGFPVYRLVSRFFTLSEKIKMNFKVIENGWFSIYSILHKFSNPAYVRSLFDDWPIDSDRSELLELEEDLKNALFEIYDKYTVEEWITTHLMPIRLKVDAIWNAKEEILLQDSWPRRPLTDKFDGLQKAAKEICTPDRKYGCALIVV